MNQRERTLKEALAKKYEGLIEEEYKALPLSEKAISGCYWVLKCQSSTTWHHNRDENGCLGCINTVEGIIADINQMVESASSESSLAELKELLEFVRGRETFGIQTDIMNRPDPDTGTKGNKTGQAYGGGYSEASRNIMDEIQRRINAKEEHRR